eukprot:m.337646 g.337646  ORF g.337646 m.337646 type:complete len:494 (+) comp18193_c0_seq1:138-1619(+)
MDLRYLLVCCCVGHAMSQSISADADGAMLVEVIEGTSLRVQYVTASGNPSGSPKALVTEDDMMDYVDAKIANVTNNMLTEGQVQAMIDAGRFATQEEVTRTYAPLDVVNEMFKKNSDIDPVISALLDDIAKLQSDAIVACPDLSNPSNGQVSLPVEHIPGSTAKYTCNDGYMLDGFVTRTCQSNSTWSHEQPTCKSVPAGEEGNPLPSCQAIYNSRKASGHATPSKAYYVQLTTGAKAQVYCDMDTPIAPGSPNRGWTLCGKYDKLRPLGSRYLAVGFLRDFVNSDSMDDLGVFSPTAAPLKWASVDCRELIDGNKGKRASAKYMMHSAANFAPKINTVPKYDAIRFTNIMDDTRADATSLFDTTRETVGDCVNRSTGGIRTYDESWKELTDVDSDPDFERNLGMGGCIKGDGHHLCSLALRTGSRFSNAGDDASRGVCAGSMYDTVYWAWYADDHGCSHKLVIGTGCQKGHLQQVRPGGRQPNFRFNYLFVA